MRDRIFHKGLGWGAVWDIGDNSMQMIMKGSGGKFTIYRGQMASIRIL